MFHPSTRIAFINEAKGYGVVATQDLPLGTLTYVPDDLEVTISKDIKNQLPKILQEAVIKYGYSDLKGNAVVSWDQAKYVNHCCDANTLSTPWGFEIAVRTILAGEEITDEYALFLEDDEVLIPVCGNPSCRGLISTKDRKTQARIWDQKIQRALMKLETVDQPLFDLLDSDIVQNIKQYTQARCNFHGWENFNFEILPPSLNLELG